MTVAPSIRVGELREPAVLQVKVSTSDLGGGSTTTWEDVRKIWVEIIPMSGTQRLENMRRNTEVSHFIHARDEGDVDECNRILYLGKVYKLEAVWSIKLRGEFLRMIAKEGVAT